MPAPLRALVFAAALGGFAAAGPAAGQGGAVPRVLRVTNATGGPLVYVHVADADGDWGIAVLDGDTLADGAARGFTVAHAACRYTLTAAAPDDALFTREDVDLCAPDGGAAVTLTPDDGDGAADDPAAGDAPTLTVLNEAGETAYTLFLRPSGADGWGDDLLADDVFEPGDTLDLPLPALADGVCRYDLRAADAEGARGVLLLQLDVCDLAEVAIPPFGPLPEEER